jgi:hypothetical protein
MVGLWSAGTVAAALTLGWWAALVAPCLAGILAVAYHATTYVSATAVGRRLLLRDVPSAMELGREALPPVLVLTDEARTVSRLTAAVEREQPE